MTDANRIPDPRFDRAEAAWRNASAVTIWTSGLTVRLIERPRAMHQPVRRVAGGMLRVAR